MGGGLAGSAQEVEWINGIGIAGAITMAKRQKGHGGVAGVAGRRRWASNNAARQTDVD